jgi:hypothetical protein
VIWIGISLALFGAWIFYAFGEPFLVLRARDGITYLRRWRLFECPLFRIYLHSLEGIDPDRDPHNHPWNARVFVLHGGYVQLIVTSPGQVRSQIVSRTNRLGVMYHRIIHVKPGTWTLTLAGPRVRAWGFLRNHVHIPWKVYVDHYQRRIMTASGPGAYRGK